MTQSKSETSSGQTSPAASPIFITVIAHGSVNVSHLTLGCNGIYTEFIGNIGYPPCKHGCDLAILFGIWFFFTMSEKRSHERMTQISSQRFKEKMFRSHGRPTTRIEDQGVSAYAAQAPASTASFLEFTAHGSLGLSAPQTTHRHHQAAFTPGPYNMADIRLHSLERHTPPSTRIDWHIARPRGLVASQRKRCY